MNLLFCANCTWEIVPMLLGAWILGSLFWWLLRGTNLVSQVKQLQTSEANLHQQNTDLQVELNSNRYELEKSQGSVAELRDRLGGLELKWRAAQEQIRELKGDG